MRILIQNCFTHLYLKATAEWTTDPETARNFPSSEKAMVFCAEHRLPEVQIVLKFESDRYDLNFPITEECQKAAEKRASSS
jgi:hypothetical protein